MAAKWYIMLEKTWKRCPNVFEGHLWNFKDTGRKKSLILTLFERFRTVTQIWIHWWLRNDAWNWKRHRRGVLLFFNVICLISWSWETTKCQFSTRFEHFRTVSPSQMHWWLWNNTQSWKGHGRRSLLFFKAIGPISRSHRPNLVTRPVAAIKPLKSCLVRFSSTIRWTFRTFYSQNCVRLQLIPFLFWTLVAELQLS